MIFAGDKNVVFSFVVETYGIKDHEMLQPLEDVPERVDPGQFQQIVKSICLQGEHQIKGLLRAEEHSNNRYKDKDYNSQHVGSFRKGGDASSRTIGTRPIDVRCFAGIQYDRECTVGCAVDAADVFRPSASCARIVAARNSSNQQKQQQDPAHAIHIIIR